MSVARRSEQQAAQRVAAPLSASLKWASTSANSAAQCRCEPTLHKLFQAAQAQ